MKKIANKLRIGEKIGLGFGLVGLLFLVVIWQYHFTFNQSLNDYQELEQVYVKQKDQAMAVEIALLNARQKEKLFLLSRELQNAEGVTQQIQNSLSIAEQMASDSSMIKDQLNKYLTQFELVKNAWVKKGLNENLGLQGSFREAVHKLEEMAAQVKSDALYLNLLQIRRAEKDLGLRREVLYKDKALGLVDDFRVRIRQSSLHSDLKEKLLAESEVYQKALINYSATVLNNQDIQGGKGLFRQSAHRLEALINLHYVPDLERNILQLRRREKDYLLRGNEKYVQLAREEIQHIRLQVDSSSISSNNKQQLNKLLDNYQHDFLALVEQNKHIAQVVNDMEIAATKVSQLVNQQVTNSNMTLQKVTNDINKNLAERSSLMLWIVVIAILLGIYFAITITLHIVKPLRKMAELLEKLTYTELIEKMPYQEDGRDEVNAMAGSLNILADHRKRFIRWWQNSMNEAEACDQLEGILEQLTKEGQKDSVTEIQKLKAELKDTLSVKKSLLSKEYQEIRKCNEDILVQSDRLNHPSVSRGVVEEGANAIRYSAELIHKTLDMLSYNRR